MSYSTLKYPALRVCSDLRKRISANLDRYLAGDFLDMAATEDWTIPLNFEVDLEPLKELAVMGAATAADDARSAMLVWKALSNLPPGVASEGRVWVRLSHVEGLPYARARWIGEATGSEAEKIIGDHFFADTRTGCRDDNALGRLWWTAYVAYCAMPEDHERAVSAIWKSADIRSNVIERSWISSRPKIAGAIVNAILTNPEATKNETAFRSFMKAMNLKGGGILFEEMDEGALRSFVASCVAG